MRGNIRTPTVRRHRCYRNTVANFTVLQTAAGTLVIYVRCRQMPLDEPRLEPQ